MDATVEKECSTDTFNDNDTQQKIEKLLAQISEIKSEYQKASEEFGIQRGKMKDLFLQKEDELKKLQEEIKRLRDERDDSRSQVTVLTINFESRLEEEKAKYESQLSTLHSLVNATLEEASRHDKEIRELKARNSELECELKLVGGTGGLSGGAGAESVLSAPGAMLSTLARKVASQLGGTDTHQQPGSENLEESMRKAKEDAEVLRSLVVPLEEEITALKTKLRETDDQLQKYKAREQTRLGERSSSKSFEDSEASEELRSLPACEMCMNYERELVETQSKVTELEKEVSVMDRLKEELKKESVFRKQMEEKWSESKEQHKQQVSDLQDKLQTSTNSLNDLRKTFTKTREEILKQLGRLSEERKTTHDKLERIQLENENLVGKYNSHSQDLQNEEIDLPNTVEALHLMWLRQREDLIKARVGLEHSEESVKTLECLCSASEQKQAEMAAQLSKMESERSKLEQEVVRRESRIEQCELIDQERRREIDQHKALIQALKIEKKKLEESESELRSRLISLQTGLENGEAVQKDFVMLSQSLQKELERLRGQNNVLRWEHEEDVTECRGCEQSFKSSKGKMNCRHCGRIFCSSCLSHKVYTGRSQRESRVCQVCHTLLDSKTAPYFSTGPPQLHK